MALFVEALGYDWFLRGGESGRWTSLPTTTTAERSNRQTGRAMVFRLSASPR